ncbi:MAG: MarC family protein [Nitrospinota bacterium]
MDLLAYFLLAYSTLFAIVDPVGVAAPFVAMTAGDSPEERRRMALVGSLAAGLVLLFFAFGGLSLFRLLGITYPAFQIAGGIILLLAALDMVRAQRVALRTSPEEQAAGRAKEDIAITPLAVPLLAGPGAISAAMVLGGKAATPAHSAVLALAIAAITLTAYLALRWSIALSRFLGTLGARVLERLVGLLLTALAVQFILNGIMSLLGRT